MLVNQRSNKNPFNFLAPRIGAVQRMSDGGLEWNSAGRHDGVGPREGSC